MNQGVSAFKNAKYGDAVEHFEQAIELDPQQSQRPLYLATAYMSQWIPGAESPENHGVRNKAKDEFLKVLREGSERRRRRWRPWLRWPSTRPLSLPLGPEAEEFDEAAKWHKQLSKWIPRIRKPTTAWA